MKLLSLIRSIAVVIAAVALLPIAAHARGASEELSRLLADLPAELVPSGILYDRVLPLSGIERFDGAPASPAATLGEWRQIYDELRRAARAAPARPPLEWPPIDRPPIDRPPLAWPPLAEMTAAARAHIERGVYPLAVMDCCHERFRSGAADDGLLAVRDGRLAVAGKDALASRRVFAATALRDHTYQGAEATFILSAESWFSNCNAAPRAVEIDFDDGNGFRRVTLDREQPVRYPTTGRKTIRLRCDPDGVPAHPPAERAACACPAASRLEAAFVFDVRALRTPAPHDTLQITATIPHQGGFGSGEAYVYLADEHAALTNPVILIEGFDLDNSMGWEELYELLNREQLLETIRARGFDAVVLNFTDAVDYIQRNAFVAVELLRQVQAAVGPRQTIAVAGASMGGLVGRYALAYMETLEIEHAVRTFISFDSPQTGADIPLGLQYWLWFFADESPDAAALLAALDSPAARQLLIYHYTDPPSATGASDPLRAELAVELAALGDYPQTPRLVAMANGSGSRLDQGFQAGDQIIRWEYRSFLVDITGNVWAVPDAVSRRIFHGLIDVILLPEDEAIVTVSGTAPLDNAPGGWRGSMAQLDTTAAPYGDIEALHPNHCFIPSVSALAVVTDDLFYDIAGDPDLLAHTPFDAVYFPLANEEHVEITPANAAWILAEIEYGTGDVSDGAPQETPVARIDAASLVPLAGSIRLRFTIPAAGDARLAIFDATGREITRLFDGRMEAGDGCASWNGCDAQARPVSPGVYFAQLRGAGFAASRRLVRP